MYTKKRIVKIFDAIIIATAVILLAVMVLSSCDDEQKNKPECVNLLYVATQA
ncbi:MAG: hypothetical protein LBD87_01060 [Prevotellaceae bacterium]|nr:hypothetical protein [Prevotellaceae bacterium]